MKDVKANFPPGRRVSGRVISVEVKKEQVDLSLKRSVVLGKRRVGWSDLQVGQVVAGAVKSVQSFGVFVRIRGSELDGLCHISEVGEEFVRDLSKQFKQGDKVKAKILRMDPQRKTISLGMKPEYLQDAPDDSESSEDEEADQAMAKEETEADEEEKEEEDVEAAAASHDHEVRQVKNFHVD